MVWQISDRYVQVNCVRLPRQVVDLTCVNHFRLRPLLFANHQVLLANRTHSLNITMYLFKLIFCNIYFKTSSIIKFKCLLNLTKCIYFFCQFFLIFYQTMFTFQSIFFLNTLSYFVCQLIFLICELIYSCQL